MISCCHFVSCCSSWSMRKAKSRKLKKKKLMKAHQVKCKQSALLRRDNFPTPTQLLKGNLQICHQFFQSFYKSNYYHNNDIALPTNSSLTSLTCTKYSSSHIPTTSPSRSSSKNTWRGEMRFYCRPTFV